MYSGPYQPAPRNPESFEARAKVFASRALGQPLTVVLSKKAGVTRRVKGIVCEATYAGFRTTDAAAIAQFNVYISGPDGTRHGPFLLSTLNVR